MALTNIATVLKQLRLLLEKLEGAQGVEILSFKRNRGGSPSSKLDANLFLVREHGFLKEDYELAGEELSRKLKTMLKWEFPRSRKVRLYLLAASKEPGRPRRKLWVTTPGFFLLTCSSSLCSNTINTGPGQGDEIIKKRSLHRAPATGRPLRLWPAPANSRPRAVCSPRRQPGPLAWKGNCPCCSRAQAENPFSPAPRPLSMELA